MKLYKFIITAPALIVLLISSCQQQQSNPCADIIFKDYNIILNDLSANGANSIYFDSVDYESILWLDTASYKKLQSIYPHLDNELEFSPADMASLVNDAPESECKIELKSIKELFCKIENLKTVLRKRSGVEPLSNFNLNPSIYIKDNKAFFTIYGYTWRETFLATYSNGNILLKSLYEIQE